MANKKQLLNMTARECYGQAVRAGIEVAVKHDRLSQWFNDNPVFADEQVYRHMMQGAQEDEAEIRKMAREIPNCIVVNVR